MIVETRMRCSFGGERAVMVHRMLTFLRRKARHAHKEGATFFVAALSCIKSVASRPDSSTTAEIHKAMNAHR